MAMKACTIGTLAEKKCAPCKGGVPPLKGATLKPLTRALGRAWKVVHDHHLEREFTFPDFQTALDFVNRVGAVAEAEGHHPDIQLGWGRVKVTTWTHKIDGLTENDFVLGAKIERLKRD
jgi:4a-hydroxytetrahydrobiopterin dehydratase